METNINSLDALDQLLQTNTDDEAAHAFLLEHFGLSHNPFPPSGIADAAANTRPLKQDTLNEIVDFLRQRYLSDATQGLVIRGDYGTGKTHTLRFIEHVVNDLMNQGEGSPRAIYVERPRIEAHELNRAIMRSLGYDTIRKQIWFAVRDSLVKELEALTEQLNALKQKLMTIRLKGRKNAESDTSLFDTGLSGSENKLFTSTFERLFDSEVISDHRTFFAALEAEKWKREDVRPYLTHLLQGAVGNDHPSELAEAFTALLMSRDEQGFASWQNLLALTTNKSLISLHAPTFLRFLLAILKINGIPYLYLLLDEFEEVPQGFLLNAKQRQDYLYTMREVFNKIQHGLGIVIAISPAGWDALAKIATPLQDVASRIINLPAVAPDEAVVLVSHYLTRPGIIGSGTPTDAQILFTPENVQNIIEQFPKELQRTPRNLVQFLHQLVNHIETTRCLEVTPEVIEDVMKKFVGMKTVRTEARGTRRSAANASNS